MPKDLYFNVYRNNSLIGYHKIDFSINENKIIANIEIKFEVTFLGFVVYDYYHQNEETWINGNLKKLISKTDKNGEVMSCKLEKIENVYNINGTSRKTKTNVFMMPTSYWKKDLVESSLSNTLNTQDCSIINFKINFLGEEKIYNNNLKTKHYKMEGKEQSGEDVIIDIWYDEDNNWSKMIFLKDGSEIEYIDNNFDVTNE